MESLNDEIKNKMVNKTFNKFYNTLAESKQIRNRIFNIAIILLNIVTIVFAGLYISNKFGFVGIKTLFDTLDYRFLCIALVLYFFSIILSITPNVTHIKKKYGRNMFGTVLYSEIVSNYYRSVSMYNNFGFAISSLIIANKCDNKELILDTKYSQKMYNFIAKIIALSILIILGVIFVLERMWIWIIVGIALLFLFLIALVINLIFTNHGEKVINFFGSVCKILYKVKIIKNIDVVYNRIIDRMITNSRSLKQEKSYIILSVIISTIELLLYGVICYLVLISICNGGGLEFIQILIGGVLIKIIFDMLPTANGTLLFELFFILLFANIYIGEYILAGLVICKMLLYFMDVVTYVFTLPFIKLFNRK